MTRERALIFLGVLVLISPWSGLPLAWLTWILSVIGIAVAAVGFTLSKTANKSPLPPATLERIPSREPESRSANIAFS